MGDISGSTRRRRMVGATAIVVIIILIAAITIFAIENGDGAGTGAISRTESVPTPAAEDGRCGLGRKLVPTCGALWGVSPDSDGLATLEKRVHRKFDIVQVWHGIDQSGLPNAKERKAAAGGRILHVNFAGKRWGGGTIQYADIAAGKFDRAITAQAKGFKKFGKPVFVTFDHETDQRSRASRGTAKQYVAAWRHIHDRYRKAGASNVIWVWVVTGYPGNFGRVAPRYPGNGYVDWLSWEAENGAGCPASNKNPKKAQSFAQLMTPFYRWLNTKGKKKGIDVRKPYMITGFGTILYPGKPSLSATWYRAVPGVLKHYPHIKAVQLWNSTLGKNCDFRITANPSITKAFAQAGAAPLLNPKVSGR